MRSLSEWPLSLDRAFRALGGGVRLYAKNDSWRAWAQGMSYVLGRLARRALPFTVFLAPTYRCQCSCAHCYAALRGVDDDAEMTTEELKEVIGQIKALGAVRLTLTGGEPLLRKDICDLVARAHEIGLITHVSTNGALLTRERVAELRRAGLDQCGIAIDDADPDTHDRLRGVPGLYEKATRGFRFLHDSGVESRFVTSACFVDLGRGMERLMDLAGRLKAKKFHVQFPYASGRWADSFTGEFSEADMDRLRGLQRFMRSPAVLFEFPTPETMCCAVKKTILYINAAGDVTPCPVIPYAIGDIRSESLAEIWKRHVEAMRMVSRGKCPMNNAAARTALRAYAGAVRSAGPGRDGLGIGVHRD